MGQMIEVKTAELIGPALDWAVAKCNGKGIEFDDPNDPWLTVDGVADQPLHSYTPSSDWGQGGPLIERERIATAMVDDAELVLWRGQLSDPFRALPSVQSHIGPTPLIAAMRCLVAAKLGDTVQVPEELLP